MTSDHGRAHSRRGAPPEVVELEALKTRHPELAGAVDMQIELSMIERRVLGRIPQPWIELTEDTMARHDAEARALVAFDDVPLDLSDLRLMVRQVTDVLRRFDILDAGACRRIDRLGRDTTLLAAAGRWYRAAADPPGSAERGTDAEDPSGQVLALALRPYLRKCAAAVESSPLLVRWSHPRCPACGGEPEMATLTATADRRLICGRCLLDWGWDATACPFCPPRPAAGLTSFATADGRYRVTACETCRRYLKVYDARRAPRPVMPLVDTIAMLPLDAAAMQKGYAG